MSPLPLTNNTATGVAELVTAERRGPSFALLRWLGRRRPFVSGGVDLRSRRRRLGSRGAVMVELLIAYIPVLFCFLAFWQLSELLVAQMVVGRASSAAGRAAVVVFPDDPMFYAGEAKNTLGGKRQGDVRLAAGMMLAASPHLSEDFEVLVGNLPEDVGAVEVTVAANFRCDRLRFVCGADGVVGLRATSSHTYHGAKYQYEPTDLSSAGSGDLFASGDASCRDGDPASNGNGGKGGKGGDDGAGGRGNGGSGGRGNGNGGRGGTGGEGSTRGGNDLCGRGSQQNPDGTCSPKNCSAEKDAKKRKRCEDDCPDPNDERDEVGQCCKALKKVKLENGQSAQRCNEPKLNCVNQESATGNNGHTLTGAITAGDTTIQLPNIAPDFAEICGSASSCTATTGADPAKDLDIKIVANLKLKQKTNWCPKDRSGKRKAEVEQIKREWSEWIQAYKDASGLSGEAWKKEKAKLDKQAAQAANKGQHPKPQEQGVSGYAGPDPNTAAFFTALEAWCSALDGADANTDYAKYLDPKVVKAEKEMMAAAGKMPDKAQQGIDTSLMLQTGSNHTEAKVIELLEGWAHANKKDLKDMDLNMNLTGDWSPCASCTRRLQDFVKNYGGTVKYCWTKGIYSSGIGRDKSFVQGNGGFIGGTIKHQGCVTIGPTGTSFTGEKLCKKGETNGRPSSSSAN